MSATEHEYTEGRLVMTGENTAQWTQAFEHIDGELRVTCGWSDEDNAWIAEFSGVEGGNPMAHGSTQLEALASLCGAVAAHVSASASPTGKPA